MLHSVWPGIVWLSRFELFRVWATLNPKTLNRNPETVALKSLTPAQPWTLDPKP